MSVSILREICIDCDGHGFYPSAAACKSCGGSGLVGPGDGISSKIMSPEQLDDLQVWLRHGRIGTGRGYQAEVQRAREIEAKANPVFGNPRETAT